MKKKKQYKKICIGALLCAAILIFSGVLLTLRSLPAFADVEVARQTTDETLLKKTLLNALDQYCYSNTYMEQNGITGAQFRDNGVYALLTGLGETAQIINVPTNVGDTLIDAKVSCLEAFNGAKRKTGYLWWTKSAGTMPGLFNLYNKSSDNITDLGYKLDESAATDSDDKCVSIKYTDGSDRNSKHLQTNSLCFKVANGKIQTSYGDVSTKNDGDDGPLSIGFNSNNQSVQLIVSGNDNLMIDDIRYQDIGYVYDRTWDELLSDLRSRLNGSWGREHGYYDESYKGPINDLWRYVQSGSIDRVSLNLSYDNIETSQGDSDVHEEFERIRFGGSLIALRYFLGNPNAEWSDVAFTDQEEYDLLKTYLIQKLGNGVSINGEACGSDKNAVKSVTGYAYFDETVSLWCPVDGVDNVESESKYNIVSTSHRTLIPATFQEVMRRITNWDFEATGTDPGTSGVVPVVPPESGTESSGEANCYTEGASLSWILCAAIQGVGGAVEVVYDTIVTDYLMVGTSEMSTESGIYSGWKQFRDIANIIFVIMLIIVIFSQVTGLGLTNYGVKKTLPTLIMVAILVNLSFIICQIAVDATNILGDGLQTMFKNLPKATGSPAGVGSIAAGILSSLGLVGAGVVTGVLAIKSGFQMGALLIPVLLALIGAVIGIIFFFLMLAVRKALVLVMVVLAPVAIICYALPNTKNLFNKWYKIFTGLLVIYPICGLLMGGGEYFSSLLLASNADGNVGFFMALTAMLLQVVPFFFIPTLVKGSLNVIGGLGAKISGFGSRLGNRAQGSVGRSRWAQERQQRLAHDSNMIRDRRLMEQAHKRMRKLSSQGGDISSLSARDQKRYRRAEYEYNRAAGRFERAIVEDEQAKVNAEREALTEGSVRMTNLRDSLRDAANERVISDISTSMVNGHMTYSQGGVEYSVDANNLGRVNTDGTIDQKPGYEQSLASALRHNLDLYDADPSNKDAKFQAQAIISRLLDAGGDNGQTIVANTLKGRKFNADGSAKSREDSRSVDMASEFISRNGKWMGQIKKTDVGSFAMINDGANSSATFKARSDYNTMGDKKITASSIPDLSDAFFEGIKQEISAGTYDRDSGAAKRLLEINSAASRAMSDPRVASRVKPETIDYLNSINREAYRIQRSQWLNNPSNVQTLTGYMRSTTTGNIIGSPLNADHIDRNGILVDSRGNQLLNSAGTPLTANDAYSQNVSSYSDYNFNQQQDDGTVIRVPRNGNPGPNTPPAPGGGPSPSPSPGPNPGPSNPPDPTLGPTPPPTPSPRPTNGGPGRSRTSGPQTSPSPRQTPANALQGQPSSQQTLTSTPQSQPSSPAPVSSSSQTSPSSMSLNTGGGFIFDPNATSSQDYQYSQRDSFVVGPDYNTSNDYSTDTSSSFTIAHNTNPNSDTDASSSSNSLADSDSGSGSSFNADSSSSTNSDSSDSDNSSSSPEDD